MGREVQSADSRQIVYQVELQVVRAAWADSWDLTEASALVTQHCIALTGLTPLSTLHSHYTLIKHSRPATSTTVGVSKWCPEDLGPHAPPRPLPLILHVLSDQRSVRVVGWVLCRGSADLSCLLCLCCVIKWPRMFRENYQNVGQISSRVNQTLDLL